MAVVITATDITVNGESVVVGEVEGVPAGTIAYFGASTVPTGFLKADGSAVSRTTYANLFTAIGTTFGTGDGSTTFNLPDLRGEFIRGFDDGRGKDSGRTFGSAQAHAVPDMTGYVQGSQDYLTGGGATWYSGVQQAARALTMVVEVDVLRTLTFLNQSILPQKLVLRT